MPQSDGVYSPLRNTFPVCGNAAPAAASCVATVGAYESSAYEGTITEAFGTGTTSCIFSILAPATIGCTSEGTKAAASVPLGKRSDGSVEVGNSVTTAGRRIEAPGGMTVSSGRTNLFLPALRRHNERSSMRSLPLASTMPRSETSSIATSAGDATMESMAIVERSLVLARTVM